MDVRQAHPGAPPKLRRHARRGAFAAIACIAVALLAAPGAAASQPDGPFGSLLGGLLSPAPASPAKPAPVLSLPLPTISVPLPSLGSGSPKVEVTVPSVTVTVPSVGVSAGGVGVTTPSVGVTTPSVGVSGSGANVSGGGATVSSSTVSTPTTTSPSGSAPTETGSGNGGGSGSGGGGSSGSSNPSSPSGGGSQGSGSKTPASSGDGHSGAGGSGGSSSASSPLARAASLTRSSATSVARGSRKNAPHARPGAASGRGGHRSTPGAPGAGDTGGAGALGPVVLTRSSVPSRGAGAPASKSSGSGNPLEVLGKGIPLPIPVPDWSKPIILALLLLAIWFGVRSRVAVRRALKLERQRAVLLKDVDVMQEALVPVIPARVGGLAVSVAYRPADGPAAGGDFYDVFVPSRGKVAVILGDVAGHGPGALKQAALTRYTLRAYLQTGLEPRAALALAGRVLADPTAEQFATVVVGLYDTRDGCLTFAGAGHPPPLVQGLQTREPAIVCASPPIGWTVPTGRRQTTVSLPRGSTVCFYSDGLIEARCKDGGLLGRERLGEILGSLGGRPKAEKLLRRVRAAADATPDDMAACILAPEVTLVAPPTHIEELEVDAQSLANGQAVRFLETCEVTLPERQRALGRAGDIAAAAGTALLCVELSSGSPSVEVSAPEGAPEAIAGGRPKVGA
jgi:Stage II sporulation protein E (SpoIIE)